MADLQNRLLGQLGRRWDTTEPLPAAWPGSAAGQAFREDLRALISAHFGVCPLWAWKDPRSCLLLSVWREVLEERGVQLSVVFAVRNPVDVANSLGRRDGMPVRKALELWFHYNIVALEAAQGLPLVFLSYDRLLANWEPELRRCLQVLQLPWPADEPALRTQMGTFIRPKLRHSLTTSTALPGAPQPVRELYELLVGEVARSAAPDERFWSTVHRLGQEFRTVPAFFEPGWDPRLMPQAPRPPYLQRTWWRWKRSIRKRVNGWQRQPA